MTKTIELIVSPTGQTRLETKGFSSSECQEASRFLEQALGSRDHETLTAEFYASSQQKQQESSKQN